MGKEPLFAALFLPPFKLFLVEERRGGSAE